MDRAKVPICILLALVFIAGMVVACTAGERVEAAEVQTGFDLVGDCEVVGTLKGNGTYYVLRFSGTDALYLVSYRWSSTVPFIDADGTPVTYDEFIQRMQNKEEK